MNETHGWQRRGISVAAMRELARRVLPRPIFDFADGGAETEWTLRRNEREYRAHQMADAVESFTVVHGC